jgi:hypothetical protein
MSKCGCLAQAEPQLCPRDPISTTPPPQTQLSCSAYAMSPKMPRVAQAFYQFPLLATELQQQIWSLVITAIPSRVVPLRGGLPWVIKQPSDDPQSIVSRGGQPGNTIDHGSQERDWEWWPRVYTSSLDPRPSSHLQPIS